MGGGQIRGQLQGKIAVAAKLLTVVERIINKGGGHIVDRNHYGRIEVVSIPAHLAVISHTRTQLRSLPAIRTEGIATVNALEEVYKRLHGNQGASYFAEQRNKIRRIIKLSKAEATIAEVLRDIKRETGLQLKSE